MTKTRNMCSIRPLLIRLSIVHKREQTAVSGYRPEFVRETVRGPGITAHGLVENKRIIARASNHSRWKARGVDWSNTGSEIKTVFGRVDDDGAPMSVTGERER